MKGFYTILLLIVSNVFMTFAWYGHLKMKQEYSWFADVYKRQHLLGTDI